MRPLLLDADAFRCLRDLGLLRMLLRGLAATHGAHITEYIARHELTQLQADVTSLESASLLSVHPLVKGSSAQVRYRQFQKDRLADKGECEAVAWALDAPPASRPVFITRDRGATAFARAQGVPVTDVLGLAVEALRRALIDRETLRSALACWEDPQIQICRPAGYRTFDLEVDERLVREDTLFL